MSDPTSKTTAEIRRIYSLKHITMTISVAAFIAMIAVLSGPPEPWTLTSAMQDGLLCLIGGPLLCRLVEVFRGSANGKV